MLSADKTEVLKSFLGGLSGQVAQRLALAVEVDRLMDGHILPHAAILESLRPVLRQERPHMRAPTPLRLFCQPFEDILTSLPRKTKLKGSIARTSLEPVWAWIAGSLLPEEAQAFVHEARALVVARKMDAAQARVADFWSLTAAAMAAGLADPMRARETENMLGGAMALADAGEMALLLSAGPVILEIQRMLPAPVPSLNETLLWDLRGVHDRLVETQPDAAPYVAVIAMNRLARPCEALRLPLQVARHSDDVLLSKTDMGLVGEILFARMETLRVAIQMTRHPLFDAQMLVEQVRSFTDLSCSITREVEIKRSGEWGKRLLADRVEIGEVMDQFMDRAPREVQTSLPLLRAPGPRTADFSHPVPPEKHAMALRYAQLIAGCRDIAANSSFGAKHKVAQAEIETEVRRYIEDVLRALRAPDNAEMDVIATQFALCVQLVAILFSKEEAELLRRRGRVSDPQLFNRRLTPPGGRAAGAA
jgi:hypothetical protein